MSTPDNVLDVDKKEIERLRATHDLWKKYAPEWDLYLAAYEGGPDFANKEHIFRHFRENPDDFLDRTKRLHYVNYCEQLVEFYTNFIFSETIDRSAGDEQTFYDEFVKDVNLKGEDTEVYMRQVSTETQIFGMVYTLVDAPPAPVSGEVVTKAQEQLLKIRPYWVFIRPSEILDWVVDSFDKFEYVKRRQMMSVVGGDGSIQVIERYTEFYEDVIEVTDIDISSDQKPILGTTVATPNTLGKVPILVHRYKRSKRFPFMGNSFLRDFAYNNREIMNLTSLLQEFLYRQCFNILAKEVESLIPANTADNAILGTSNVIEYPKGAKAPQYVSPPADPAKFIQDERQHIKQEMFSRASQDAMKELFNGGGASGFSQAQSFSKTVPFISSRADMLEDAENALMALTFERISKVWNGRIKYKDRYEITNVADAMNQFLILTRDLLLPSETFDKTELKRFVKEFDGKISAEAMAKVLKEIDAMDYPAWKKVQQDALVPPPKPVDGKSAGKAGDTIGDIQKESKTPTAGAPAKK